MLYIKALHILFVVTWFSGLFYIVRLFVYHSESNEMPHDERNILVRHFKIAEKRLWYGITWPSAILTWIFGIWLIIITYGFQIPNWLWVKICFVLGLTIYHLLCGRIFRQLQNDDCRYSGMKMRIWNEVATVFLVAIIFIVILKDTTEWIYGLAGLLVFSLLLLFAIKVYKKTREKNRIIPGK
jgi:protoporphyrinogen IX oxidase